MQLLVVMASVVATLHCRQRCMLHMNCKSQSKKTCVLAETKGMFCSGNM